jgi:hypothetical protein
MKPAIFALSLALLGAPTLASAQPAPPPDQQAAPQQGQRDPQRAQFMAQMRQLHQQMRSQVLGALTPANRQLLANLAGQLAIAATPDYRDAAARLDRSLSANERNAILQADSNFHTQSKALFEQMRASTQPPQDGQAAPDNAGPPRPMNGGQMRQRTAGQILLGLSSFGPHHM